MVDIALDLDPNSANYLDLKIVNGDLVLVDGKDAILQDIITALRVYFAEWFLDNTIGIDYFGQILVKDPDQSKIDAIFINVILSVPGVDQLNEYAFTSDFNVRRLNVRFIAETTSGTVSYSGTVQA